jgi:hypothetical protein
MCLCINLSLNLVKNLITRLADDIMDVFYCKCLQKPTAKPAQHDRDDDECTMDSDSEFYDEKTGWSCTPNSLSKNESKFFINTKFMM